MFCFISAKMALLSFYFGIAQYYVKCVRGIYWHTTATVYDEALVPKTTLKNSPENLSTQGKNGRNPRRGNSKWDPPFLDVMGCNREQWVTTGAMSDLVPKTSYTIDPFTCPYMWPWSFNIIYMKTRTELKCALNTTLFLQFFHFVHDSCQSHNGLINSRPSWRQWAGFGLTQELWFG